MSVEVRVPALGESVVEATVGAWSKQAGEAVQPGEPLVQLETDKVNVEVTAERAGILERIEHPEGDVVHPGDVLATLTESTVGTEGARSADGVSVEPATAPDSGRPPASPVARRIAEDQGIDLGQVAGTGTAGRVTREDVERFLDGRGSQTAAEAPAVPSAPPPPLAPTPPPSPAPSRVPGARGEERVRMSRRRLTIARRLVETQHAAAMLTTFNEVDMTAVVDVRARRKERFREEHGISLGFMSFFVKGVVGALKAFPRLNAEIQDDEIVLKHYYDIGVAVGVEEGLVVPVVRDADRKSFAEIERAIADLAEKARAGRLTLEDLRGGTFTVSNGGVYGSLLSTPILNGPQAGILGMHRIQERPVALGGQVVIRPMMYLALSYDHRIVDGREAVQFLVRLKELIEDPERLLLES